MHFRKDWVLPTAIGVSSFLIGVGVGYGISRIHRRRNSVEDFATTEGLERGGNSVVEDPNRDIEEQDSPQQQLPFESSPRELKPKQEQIVQARVVQHIEVLPLDKKIEMVMSEDVPIEEDGLSDFVYEDRGDFLVSDLRNGCTPLDYEMEERLYRSNPKHPYVISYEEYNLNENDWPQQSVIYYAGDCVYVDNEEKPVYNYMDIFGDVDKKFGYGSKDPSIVFVRNCKIQAEYEILRDPGYYSEDILGVEIEHAYKANRAKKNKQKPKFKLD